MLSREERLFAKARHVFQAEVDIVKFLKRLRSLEAFHQKMNDFQGEKNEHDFKIVSLKESEARDVMV